MSRVAVAAVLLMSSVTVSAATIELREKDGATRKIELARSERVIVEFEGTPVARGASADEARATLDRFRSDLPAIDRRMGKTVVTTIRREYTVTVLGAAVEVAPEAVAELERLPYVRAVHPDVRVTKYDTETVDAGKRVNAVNLPTRGAGIRVGVIDTGIDYHHPALGGGFGPGHKVAGGWDYVNDDGDPDDDGAHGTHVAGIIAANSAELQGVAPDATLYAYKVLDNMGGGFLSDVVAAIDRSVDPNRDGKISDRLDVINLSLGGPGEADDLASRAADSAMTAGVVVVIAAGNAGAVGSIGSPGTSRRAITVGAVDSAGGLASFSSRGPSAKHLHFKPDVCAPGVDIVSARMGGGLLTASGTSMAAPHVAGVAALLRSLHPGWTTADIKSALVTGAVSMFATPLARGAGRVDAERSAAATLFVSDSGLSFGLNPNTSGNWEATRTVTVTNRSSAAQAFNLFVITPTSVSASAPARVEIGAGQSQAVELRLSADLSGVPFPNELLTGGEIVFNGASTFSVPWGFVRGARTTLTTDSDAAFLMALSENGMLEPTPYSPIASELFSKPGEVWDFLLMGLEFGTGTFPALTGMHVVVQEGHAVSGDEVVPVLRGAATAKIALDSRDADGVRFRDLPRTSPTQQHGIALIFTHHTDRTGLMMSLILPSLPALSFSPASPKYDFAIFETYYDFGARRIYNVQHELLDGVTGSKVLTRDRSSYAQARLRWRPSGPLPQPFAVCTVVGVNVDWMSVGGPTGCAVNPANGSQVLDYYTTSEQPGSVSGILLGDAAVSSAVFRGIDGRIVPTDFWTASAARYRMADGEEVSLGDGPLFPFMMPGTAKWPMLNPGPGLYGRLGEVHIEASPGMSWTMYDGASAPFGTGSYGSALPPNAVPNGRLVAVSEGLPSAAGAARGELEVRFGPNAADLDAPSLTSMRILDAGGRVADRVFVGTAASLAFSAVDLSQFFQLSPLRREATKVWYRVSGSSEWKELTAVFEYAEEGGERLMGIPAGEIYRVDLSPATANADRAIDLRIAVEDLAGNRSTWTHAPAFAVGGEPPKRRRSVR